MIELRDFELRDKLVALLAPAIGAALFSGISIVIDILAGRTFNLQDPEYLFENVLYAANGAILTASLFAARFIILSTRLVEKKYI